MVQGLIGLALMGAVLAFFVDIARRDHNALARGQVHFGDVVAVLPAHDWDPFDGGRLIVEWPAPALEPNAVRHTATIWTDNDATDYTVGEPIRLFTDGSYVRSDDESNDPAPLGFAIACAGVLGVALLLLTSGQALALWRARRWVREAKPDEIPLYAVAQWQPTTAVGWGDEATRYGWSNYALAAVGYAVGGLVLGVVTWRWHPGGRAEETTGTLAVAAIVGAFVMAWRLRSWHATLRSHPWQEWRAEIIELDYGNGSADYARLTTTHDGREYRVVARCLNSSFAQSWGTEWHGRMRVFPDTWRTLVVLDPSGRMRRYALPRTARIRRRWAERAEVELGGSAAATEPGSEQQQHDTGSR
jgi:hypothetical protein